VWAGGPVPSTRLRCGGQSAEAGRDEARGGSGRGAVATRWSRSRHWGRPGRVLATLTGWPAGGRAALLHGSGSSRRGSASGSCCSVAEGLGRTRRRPSVGSCPGLKLKTQAETDPTARHGCAGCCLAGRGGRLSRDSEVIWPLASMPLLPLELTVSENM
jgi:hypothetical protein